MSAMQPFQLSLPLLAILAECEAWVVPCPDTPEIPYLLTFHVPQQLADRFMFAASSCRAPDASVEPVPSRASEPGRGPRLLR